MTHCQLIVESLERKDHKWESIHGGATRLKDEGSFTNELWFQPILTHVQVFCHRFGIDCDWPILLSHQILQNPPGFRGQDMHLDCYGQYIVVLVALHPCRSTMFLDVAYCKDSKTKLSGSGYPYKWWKERIVETAMKTGELLIFFTNTPHAAPPNTSKYNRLQIGQNCLSVIDMCYISLLMFLEDTTWMQREVK